VLEARVTTLKTCKKKGYATKGEAVAAAEALRRKPLVFYARVYRCGCKRWHVTTTPSTPGKPKRRRH
jgi:hypothetical protein